MQNAGWAFSGVASGGCSVVSSGLLFLAASLVAECRLVGSRTSVFVALGLNGIFLDQGSNPCALRCQADSQPLDHQGSPFRVF